MRETESREETRTRLAWVMAATGYDPDAPGAWWPHLLHADGSMEGRDGSLWWLAGEESAVLHGMYTADELIDLGEHMLAVERALLAMQDAGTAPMAPPAVRRLIAPPGPATSRIRLALWLLRLGLRVVPEGPSRDMLRHLLRYWRRRWYAA